MATTPKAGRGSAAKRALLFFALGQIVALALSNILGSLVHGPSGHPAQTPPAQTPPARARAVDRSAWPHPCGLVFFYHVPSTGGATINTWLGQYADDGSASYFTQWGRKKDGTSSESMQDTFINGNKRKRGMNEFVKDMGKDEWRIAHCHHGSMHLNRTETYLTQWRASVESQGCAFIATVMFREPLSHSLSLYKHVDRFNSSRDVWAQHLHTRSEMGHWQSQLDYFLYNFITRNPDGVDKDAKIHRALQILQKHFDIVTVGDHDRFKKELLARTGWEDKEMRRTNTHRKELVFTKKEVEELQTLMEDNGDVEFIYEAKKMFGGG